MHKSGRVVQPFVIILSVFAPRPLCLVVGRGQKGDGLAPEWRAHRGLFFVIYLYMVVMKNGNDDGRAITFFRW